MNIVNKIFGSLRWQKLFWRNDSRWGQGDGNKSDSDKNKKPNRNSPPDMEEIWRDLSAKIIKIGDRKKGGGNGGGRGQGPNLDFLGSNKVFGLVLAIIVLIWIGSGFYIVQEGQKAVVTQFGRYNKTVNAGLNFRWPFPIQHHEIVNATQLKAVTVGDDNIIPATSLKTSGMLTSDGNIVEILFEVQYRLKVDTGGVRDFLFETRNPDDAVTQVSESVMREVVGKMSLDDAIKDQRDQISLRVQKQMQVILDHYKTGVDIVAVNMLQGGVRPPEQVKAAFDDVLKAEQEYARLYNEAEAYANNKLPRAQGVASRLTEDAKAYTAQVTSKADGDAQRFNLIVAEYKKSPKVVRDRIYIDVMQDVYKDVNKVIVDSKQNSNLLFLPLEQLLKQKNINKVQNVDDGSGIKNTAPNISNISQDTNDERGRSRESRN